LLDPEKFKIDIQGINLRLLLETINRRIEKLLDREHQIWHSYFLKIKSFEDLKRVFKDNIIPLLQEYFFGDYGKIGLILGESFFVKKNNQSH
jgi:5-methylcytosine-specific restriction protein B